MQKANNQALSHIATIFSTMPTLKIEITKTYVGRYATSMEMAGMSITIFKLNNELNKYLSAPSKCPFWNN